MARFVLLLGSNLDPEPQLEQARTLIARQFGVLRTGQQHYTADREQLNYPPYLNMGLEIATAKDPAALKAELRLIEQKLGRTRPAARVGYCEIDIDITLQYQGRWIWVDHKAEQQAYAQLALVEWLRT